MPWRHTATFTGDPPDSIDVANACLLLATDDACALRNDEVGIRSHTEICGGPETATVGGLLDGIEVDYKISRTNGCGIADWERVCARLVPLPSA